MKYFYSILFLSFSISLSAEAHWTIEPFSLQELGSGNPRSKELLEQSHLLSRDIADILPYIRETILTYGFYPVVNTNKGLARIAFSLEYEDHNYILQLGVLKNDSDKWRVWLELFAKEMAQTVPEELMKRLRESVGESIGDTVRQEGSSTLKPDHASSSDEILSLELFHGPLVGYVIYDILKGIFVEPVIAKEIH